MQTNTLKYYEKNANSLIQRYELANVSELQNLLLKIFNSKSKLLEIGCGSGRDTMFMVRNNCDITGVDDSLNMIEEAKKIHPELSEKLFHKILPDGLQFDKKFDGIYSIATLMHLLKTDINKTISEIYNLLNENGKFMMSVSLFRDDIDKNGFDEKGRFFLVLPFEEWVKMCEDSGFKILETKRNKDGLNRDGIEWLTLVASK